MGIFFYCFLAMAEGPTAPLVFLSQITKSATAAIERSAQETTGTAQRILIELLAGERTTAELADVLGVGVATVGKYLKKDLAKEGRVHSLVLPGNAAAVWRIGAAP